MWTQLNGPVPPEIYSTISIAKKITWTISCIVIAIGFASVSAPTYFSTTHHLMISLRNRNSWVNCRYDWTIRLDRVIWPNSVSWKHPLQSFCVLTVPTIIIALYCTIAWFLAKWQVTVISTSMTWIECYNYLTKYWFDLQGDFGKNILAEFGLCFVPFLCLGKCLSLLNI